MPNSVGPCVNPSFFPPAFCNGSLEKIDESPFWSDVTPTGATWHYSCTRSNVSAPTRGHWSLSGRDATLRRQSGKTSQTGHITHQEWICGHYEAKFPIMVKYEHVLDASEGCWCRNPKHLCPAEWSMAMMNALVGSLNNTTPPPLNTGRTGPHRKLVHTEDWLREAWSNTHRTGPHRRLGHRGLGHRLETFMVGQHDLRLSTQQHRL